MSDTTLTAGPAAAQADDQAADPAPMSAEAVALFRNRRTAQCLQDKFHDRLKRHINNGLKQVKIDGLTQEDVTPALLEYGIARSKKRLSVDDEDFATMIRKAQKIAQRCACGAPITAADIKDSLDQMSEMAVAALEESRDRAVNQMVARHQDRPAFYEGEIFHGEDRVYFDLPQPDSAVAPQVEAALGELGYSNMDYANGLITNAHGDQTRIGKALAKHGFDKINDAYQRDPARADPAVVMISRDAEDVARMSTDRDWKTCIVAGSHRFERHMPEDLKHGMLVAYLIRPNDPEAHEPMAVMNLKPYKNDEQGTILVPNRPYGVSDDRFPTFVKQVVDATVNRDKTGTFTMERSMLSDDLDYEVERIADGTIYSNLTLMPPEPKQTGRKLDPGTKLGDRIAI